MREGERRGERYETDRAKSQQMSYECGYKQTWELRMWLQTDTPVCTATCIYK